jgi:hypothetical protein
VHFGHRNSHDHGRPDGDQPIAVDEGLEQAIDAVEAAVDAYLDTASSDRHDALVAALAHLDELVALGDGYTNRVAATRWGYGVSPGASVLGARGSSPIAEDLPTRVLQAQVALVRCAKDAVTDGGAAASSALRNAAEELAGARVPPEDGAPASTVVPPPISAPQPTPLPPLTSPPPAVPPQPGLLVDQPGARDGRQELGLSPEAE